MRGRILKGIAGFYYVLAEDGCIYECKPRGLFRKKKITPLAGDNVTISLQDPESATIEEIADRINCFDRPPVANVELLVLVASVKSPDVSPGLIDRFTVAAEMRNCELLICFSKSDLAAEKDINALKSIYEKSYKSMFLSAKTGDGIDRLKSELQGKNAALAGPSGAGKSTLVNALLGREESETGELSQKTLRGKNTTRHSELFAGDGFFIFDTPGFTSFEDKLPKPEELAPCFPEFREYIGQCRFSDCSHTAEPECAVKTAVESGLIHRSRYASYLDMYALSKKAQSF